MSFANLASAQDQSAKTYTRLSFNVIIPAHNEETVIERCLTAIQKTECQQSFARVLVIANGCSDRTAEMARRYAPDVEVIETTLASKSNAINIGLAKASDGPCLILDADVVCDFRTLEATAMALLKPETQTVSPALRIDDHDSSKTVQRYYRVWRSLPYAKNGLIGGGLYGLSVEALEALGSLPMIIADDLFIRSHFSRPERRSIAEDFEGNEVFVTMFPPRHARDLIRIEARRWRGTYELKRVLGDQIAIEGNSVQSIFAELHRSFNTRDLITYLAIKFCGRLLGVAQIISNRTTWDRDLTTRGQL